MRHPTRIAVFSVLLVGLAPWVGGTARADSATDVYRAMGLAPADILTGTILNARVLPGGGKQVVCIATYFTGKREKDDAINVRLQVLEHEGGKLVPGYGRDFGEENGGNVGDGNLQLVDLDTDGLSEIIVSFESYSEPLIDQRLGEVITHHDGGFRTAWSGALDYDATRAARKVPVERRDRFSREIDFSGTLRTRGVTLFFTKKVIAVAGERLPEPKIVQETFPLGAPSDR